LDVLCNAILPVWASTARKKLAVCGFLAVAFSLASCSGPISTGSGNSPGSSAPLVVTLRAAPLPPLGNTNVLSFSATVVGVSLTPSTGGSVNVPLNSALYQVDFARLQSDTALLALSTAIPAGKTGFVFLPRRKKKRPNRSRSLILLHHRASAIFGEESAKRLRAVLLSH